MYDVLKPWFKVSISRNKYNTQNLIKWRNQYAYTFNHTVIEKNTIEL